MILSALLRRLEWILFPLLAACVGRFWLPLTSESFWLDETITEFAVQHGTSHPSFAPGAKLGETVYYWLPKASQALFGFSEVVVRLPSLLLALGTLFLVARIARRLIHPQAGWIAAFLFFASHEFTRQATDARPYGLGTFVAVTAIYTLIRWLDESTFGWSAAFVVAGALLIQVHLLYWPFYAILPAYSIVRRIRNETTVTGVRMAAVFGILAALIAPEIPVTLSLAHEAKVHVVATMPNRSAIVSGFQIPFVVGVAIGSWLVVRIRGAKGLAIPRSTQALLILWWIWQPLCLLAASWTTGNSVFLGRYFALAIPGAILTVVMLVSPAVPDWAWKPVGGLVATALLIAGLRTPLPARNSDWRDAAQAVDGIAVCPSPIVEAIPPAWTPDYPLPAYFYPHLDTYPVRASTILLPARLGDEGERYATGFIAHKLRPAGRFLIYGGVYTANLWADWFWARPEFAGWSRREELFGDVTVHIFRKDTRD